MWSLSQDGCSQGGGSGQIPGPLVHVRPPPEMGKIWGGSSSLEEDQGFVLDLELPTRLQAAETLSERLDM